MHRAQRSVSVRPRPSRESRRRRSTHGQPGVGSRDRRFSRGVGPSAAGSRGHRRRRRSRDNSSGSRTAFGATAVTMDVTKGRDLMELIGFHDVVVSAIPYALRLRRRIRSARNRNPLPRLRWQPVRGRRPDTDAPGRRGQQRDDRARLWPRTRPGERDRRGAHRDVQTSGVIDSIQMRVGALPQTPIGTLEVPACVQSCRV